jgi:hypothetical protein
MVGALGCGRACPALGGLRLFKLARAIAGSCWRDCQCLCHCATVTAGGSWRRCARACAPPSPGSAGPGSGIRPPSRGPGARVAFLSSSSAAAESVCRPGQHCVRWGRLPVCQYVRWRCQWCQWRRPAVPTAWRTRGSSTCTGSWQLAAAAARRAAAAAALSAGLCHSTVPQWGSVLALGQRLPRRLQRWRDDQSLCQCLWRWCGCQ